MTWLRHQALQLAGYFVAYVLMTFLLACLMLAANVTIPGLIGLLPALAVVCGVAAVRRNLVSWAVLCLAPLLLISLDWLGNLRGEDPFGMRWVDIQLFTGVALITAATAVLNLLATFHNHAHGVAIRGQVKA